ncbi:hypothetical protein ACFLW8_06110, partial [Chloroflexota bacterium]
MSKRYPSTRSWRLPHIVGSVRIGLWASLLLVTSLIFLYPTDWYYQYAPVDSIYVFPNLALFGTLYYIWMIILLLLLFSQRKQECNHWENLVLIGIFALGFSGYWAFLTHGYFGEWYVQAAGAEYIVEQGHIPWKHPSLGSSEFPSMIILLAAVCDITSLETFDAITMILLLGTILFSCLVYITFSNVFQSPHLASFATLLLLIGNKTLTQYLPQYHPRGFTLLLFVAFLALITEYKYEVFKTWPHKLIVVILLLAITTTHFITSVCLFLVMLGIYIVQKFSKSRLTKVTVVSLCLALTLAWQAFFPISA